jgi:hypothetical protein
MPAARTGDRLSPWPLVVACLPAAAILLSQLQVNDLAYQVRAGQLMGDASAILRADVFTYTIAGAPWTNLQWGAQLTFAGLFAVGGWRTLIVVQAVIVAGVEWATYRRTRDAGAAPLPAAILTLAAFVTALVLPGALALRPQLLALPLFVVSAWIVRGRGEAPRRLLWLPVVGVVWANLHGSFPLLTLLLTLAFVADAVGRRRRLAAWTGGLALVSLLTPAVSPWGFGAYRYLVDVSSSPVARDVIAEWRSILTQMPAGPIFVFAALGTLAIAWRGRRGMPLDDALGLIAFTALVLWSGRNVLWWSVVVPPILGARLTAWAPGGAWSRSSTRVVGAAMAALLLLGAVRVGTRPTDELLSEDATPGITATLNRFTQEDTRPFVTRWASWFELALPMQQFVDARVELFPDRIWDDYFLVVGAGEGWEAVLDRWEVGVVVAARGDDDVLIAALAASGTWMPVYEDAHGIVFARVGGQSVASAM